jgi:hypothetical protein
VTRSAPGSVPAGRNGPNGQRTAPRDGQPQTPGRAWSAAAPEIVIAVLLTAATAAAGYAVAGVTGASVVVAGAATVGFAALRSFLAPGDPAHGDDYLPAPARSSMPFTGYWRKRLGLSDGIRSMAAYDCELRGTLQDLLAARLAERHGVSLQAEPAAARRLLCPAAADESLWYWVDPARPATTAGTQQGIPPRTLARLIDRLERL